MLDFWGKVGVQQRKNLSMRSEEEEEKVFPIFQHVQQIWGEVAVK